MTIPNGARYYLCGTVTGIPDGAIVQVNVLNYFYNNGQSSTQTGQYNCTVDGGAFISPVPFPFGGQGYYTVGASHQGFSAYPRTGMVRLP